MGPGDSKLDPFATMDPQAVLKACVARGWKGLRVGDHDTAVELGDVVALVLSGKAGEAHAKRLQGTHGAWPKTPRFVDPSSDERRVAYFFRLPQGVTHLPTAANLHGAVEGVSVLTAGRELVPPSVKDNVDLRWERTVHPLFTDVQPLPGYLVEMVRNPVEARRAWTATQTPSGATPRTDYGNAERLVRRHGRDLRYCAAWGAWLVWDGVRWVKDADDEVMRRAKETVRSIAVEAATSDHEETRRALLGHAIASEKGSRLDAMIKLARSEAGVPVDPSALDTDPWLLNVQNGTIDLRTGELRPHRREDLITRVCPVAYDPAARSDDFERFLARVQPDEAIRSYLQRFLGYACTGVVREHVFPIWFGKGRNGKGTLVDAVRATLGPYAVEIPTELLTARRHDAHPTERATLFGARFATASETERDCHLATALVKRMTGGDVIKARYMRQDFFEFEPTHKLALQTNNKPVIRETANAIWDRIHLVPWAVRIPDEERDGTLRDRLKTEARAAVLAWLVRGCRAWDETGLSPPDAVRCATREYEAESDPIGSFLDARTTRDPDPLAPNARPKVLANKLYEAYAAWCRKEGAEVLTNTAFGLAMATRDGVEKKKNGHGLNEYRGLRVLPEPDPTDPTETDDGD